MPLPFEQITPLDSKTFKESVRPEYSSKDVLNEVFGQLIENDNYILEVIQGVLNWTTPPLTKNSTGTVGQRASDGNYFYYCYETNKWSRTTMTKNW
jgi:hypothetical protein